MEFAYVLYSKTRKVLYLHEQDHTRFWSKYIRSKYPKDQWYIGRDIDVDYIQLMRNVKECRRINLIDSTDHAARKLQKEIYESMEQNAITHLDGVLFIVFYENHGEMVLLYNGPYLHQALLAKQGNSRVEHIEVWKNGRFVDTILSELDYRSKFTATAV